MPKKASKPLTPSGPSKTGPPVTSRKAPPPTAVSAPTWCDKHITDFDLSTNTVIHGKPGAGKSTFLGYLPNPILLVSSRELGMVKIMQRGKLPQSIKDWIFPIDDHDGLMRMLDNIRLDCPPDRKCLAIDFGSDAERNLFTNITKARYGNKDDEFYNFGKGPSTAATRYWPEMIQLLEEIRTVTGLDVFVCFHSEPRPTKDPTEESYESWQPKVHYKSWGVFDQWADNVLFFHMSAKLDKKNMLKVRATEGNHEVWAANAHPAIVSKARDDLASVVPWGDNPKGLVNYYWKAIHPNDPPPYPGVAEL